MIIYPSKLCGEVDAISSKSQAHRFLICAALAERDTKIKCNTLCEDINATVRCLNALGADIKYIDNTFYVSPIKNVNHNATLDCGESGSTLRFLLPVCAALGSDSVFVGAKRLFERPLSPLYEILTENGCELSEQGKAPLTLKGKLQSGTFEINQNVSSQFISGLMFANLVNKNIKVKYPKEIQSKKYIDMTVEAIEIFDSDKTDFEVEGDWSNAAFFLCSNSLGADIKINGLNEKSLQGDKEIVKILNNFPKKIDASQIPDLIPVISVVACKYEGITEIINAKRLRYKECDRLSAIAQMLTNLGAEVREFDDGLKIISKGYLNGGEVNSFNDHRIAMSAAVASLICKDKIILNNAEAVKKSYPGFFDDFKSLGGKFEV